MNNININLINKIFEENLSKNDDIVKEILKYNSYKVDILPKEERAFPGDKDFLDTGYYKTMLKRYLFSGSYFCKNSNVLDTCCGLGWGSYIISQYARQITAFDIAPEVIDFCQKNWKAENIKWLCGNTLDLSFLKEQTFDIILGMETIEHFTKPDGEKYISQATSVLKQGGFFVGTSAFPENKVDAEHLCKTNPYHLYIFTYEEMMEILLKYFSEATIISNWMFTAKK